MAVRLDDKEIETDKISFEEEEERGYIIGGLTVIGILVILLHLLKVI
ncbi:MAG: hypothetical protein AMQ22_01333 [Candidatus Methanofastidiosum methylothiophilum]|jgi:hypothetical protein|uniref:Uncharacterized protein n=1 Tax=Candidatus Methanofastidiosum methylothiophilum TaxID=1705564 RepID=A0A150J285_9EURY|nr:MAG: hypothetical protein AMQ22_01333 [Candidatus Methanofastidiosum methylthiophilus]